MKKKKNGNHKPQEEVVDRGVLNVDRNSLDVEWERQAEVVFEYGEKLAEARQDLAEAEAEFDTTKAELDKAIRENPEDYGIVGKPTETAIKLCILKQSEMDVYRRRVSKAKHRVDILAVFLSALDHKKKALEKMVDLYGMSYFSRPQAFGDRSRDAKEKLHTERRREENREVARKTR